MANYNIDVKAKVNVQQIKNSIKETLNSTQINVSPKFKLDVDDKNIATFKNTIANYFQNEKEAIPIKISAPKQENITEVIQAINKKFVITPTIKSNKDTAKDIEADINALLENIVKFKNESKNIPINFAINIDNYNNLFKAIDNIQNKEKEISNVDIKFKVAGEGQDDVLKAFGSVASLIKIINENNAKIGFSAPNDENLSSIKAYIEEYFKSNPVTLTISQDVNDIDLGSISEKVAELLQLKEQASQESIEISKQQAQQQQEIIDKQIEDELNSQLKLQEEEERAVLDANNALQVAYDKRMAARREREDKENADSREYHDALKQIVKEENAEEIEIHKTALNEKKQNLEELVNTVREKAQENIQIEEETAQQTINSIKEITVEAQQQAIAERAIDDERIQKKQEIAEESKQLEKEASEVTKSELQGTLETVRQTLQERTNITRQSLEDTKNLNKTVNDEIEANAKQDSNELQRIYSENIEHLNYLYQNNSINFEKYAHDVMSTVKDAFKDGIIPEETVKKASDSLEEMRNILPQAFEAGVNGAQQFQNSVDKVEKELQEATQDTNSFTEALNNFGSSSNNIFNSLMRYFGVTKIISGITNSFSKMVDEVKSLDVELTEFSKVSDLTSSQTERFISDAYELGSTIAKTGTEVVTATTLFKKMGYTVDESMKFAKDALMWTNVADGMVSVEEASNMLISTMKAFGEETVNTTQIIDALNEVSNNYSTSSSALSNNLSTVAATMAESGVSLEQTIGLMTAGIEIMPDKASKVANGLKTISQRIRQIDGDTADKLDEFLGSKGKSRFDETTGQLKSTYDILTEFSDLWEDLTINERQYIGEVMAGKNQITVLNALMTNFATAVEATETAMNSAGSAATENIRVLNSIQGHINNFKSAFSELSNDLIDSNLLKRIIDIGTEIIRWLDDFIKSGRLPKIAESIIGIGTALETIQIAKTIAGFVESFDIWTLAVTACASAFSVLITAVTDFVNKTREAQEQADYFLKLGGTGLGEKYSKSIEDALKEYEKLKEKIDNASSKEEKSKYVDKLVNLQTELKNIGIEVDLISGKYEDQIKLLKQESEQQHLLALAEKEREYSDYQQSKNGSGGMLRNLIVENESFFTNGKGFSNLPTQYEQQINDAVQQLGESLVAGKTLEDILDSTELSIKEKRELIEQGYKEYLESSKYLTEQVKTATGEDTKAFYQQQADNYQRFAGILKQIFDDILSEEAKYSEVVDEAKKVVRDKLENFGADLTKLTKEELASFKETIESGDLSEINIPLDELGMSFSQLKELISDPELKEAFLGLIDDEIIKKKAQKVIDSLSGIEEQTEFTLSGAIASMSDYAAQAEILAQAQEDITNSGVITAETLKKIADAGLEAYLTIDEETGSLVVNTQAFMDNNASIEDNAIAKYINYEKSKLDSEIEAILAGNIDASTESITNQTNALNTHGEAALTDAEKTAQSVLTQAQEMLLLGEITEDQFYAMQRAAAGYRDEIETGIAALRGYFGAVTQARTATSRGASHSGSSGSSSKSSSSTSDREAQQAQREAEQAAKNAQKAWKDAFDALYKELKTYLDMGAITEAEYYDALETLVDKFYKDREGYEEEYWKYHDEIVKGRKKYLEDQMADLLSKGETLLERQLDAEVISQEEYFDKLETLYRTYYTDQEELEEHLWEIQKQRYEYQIQEIDKQIKAYEDQMSNLFSKGETLLERQLDANIISQEEYFDKLETLYRTYYTDQEELEEHLWEIQKQRYEYQLQEIDKQIKAYEDELNSLFNKGESLLKHQLEMDEITEDEYLDLLESFYKSTITDQEELEEKLLDIKERRYKREKQKNEEHLKELEKQLEDYYNQAKQMHDDYVESLEEDAEGIDAVISYAIDVLDEEIAKLEEEKKALDESNNALEEQIKLQELEDKLQQAKNRKVRVYRKGQGFVYEQDTKAISEAQSAIDKYKQEIAHKKEISMIDERIKELQKYKEAWSNIPKEYQKSQVRLLAMQQATSDSQKKILNGDQEFIDSFTKKYNETQDKLQAANKRNIDEINDFIFGTEEGAGLKQKIEEINAEIEKVKDIDVGARFKDGENNKNQLEDIIDRIERLNSTDPDVSPIAALNQQKIELQAEWKETNDVTDLDSILSDMDIIYGRITNLNKKKIQLQAEWKKTNDTKNQYETILDNISNIQAELNKIKVKDLNITNWCNSIDKMIKELEELTQAAENASKAGIDVEEITSGNDDKPSNNNNNNDFKVGDKVTLTEEGRKYIISRHLSALTPQQQNAYLDRDLYLWGGGDTGQRIGTKTEPVWDIPWESKYITHASSSSSSGNSSDDDAIPIDNDDIYVPPQWASGTLGTSSKTFMINEKGVEAMVTPEGTVISAPTPGYGVIKNEYTERLTDFAADPLSFLSKTFSGYSGTYQNNTSKSEVININGNLTLPNVTDGISFIDSIKTVALQYTTRRN